MSQDHDGSDPGISVVRRKSDVEFDAELAAEMVNRTSKLGNREVELALQVKQAREFMSWSVNHMRTSWLDWVDESSKVLTEVTQLRMAFDRETKTVISATKDIKSQFSDKEFRYALDGFEKMVNLLERMKQLKEDGTLGAFESFVLSTTCKT